MKILAVFGVACLAATVAAHNQNSTPSNAFIPRRAPQVADDSNDSAYKTTVFTIMLPIIQTQPSVTTTSASQLPIAAPTKSTATSQESSHSSSSSASGTSKSASPTTLTTIHKHTTVYHTVSIGRPTRTRSRRPHRSSGCPDDDDDDGGAFDAELIPNPETTTVISLYGGRTINVPSTDTDR